MTVRELKQALNDVAKENEEKSVLIEARDGEQEAIKEVISQHPNEVIIVLR